MMEMDVTKFRPGPIKAINQARLIYDLGRALGAHYLGLKMIGEDRLVLVIADDIPGVKIEEARLIVQAHDPRKLTPEQEASLVAQQKLDMARRALAANPDDREAQYTWLMLEVGRMVKELGAAGVLSPQGSNQEAK